MERRLAAILAADVVGYSRLMGTDEAGMLDALKAHREDLIEPKIAEHEGARGQAHGRRDPGRVRQPGGRGPLQVLGVRSCIATCVDQGPGFAI